jgi:hypothetical protein
MGACGANGVVKARVGWREGCDVGAVGLEVLGTSAWFETGALVS